MMLQKNKFRIIGLMSGTSVDGLDIACCEFTYEDHRWHYAILAASTYPYSDRWQERLHQASALSAEEFVCLDVEYGRLLGEYVLRFMDAYAVEAQYVASHGHTVFHQPERGITAQIGHGAAIAAVCRLPVVCDFRTADVVSGGQGAPLVPIGDEALFADYAFCLNLGGIANISYDADGKRLAFDICPCNMALNFFAQRAKFPFDHHGNIARKGKVRENVWKQLNDLSYYAVQGAKSLGREWFERFFLPLTDHDGYPIEDILATCTEHIACQIGKSTRLSPKGSMLLTGGGAKNAFLVERIKLYSAGIDIIIPDVQIVDYKEALIFAFLGCLRLNKQINILQSVTGAAKDSVSGAVYWM
jgi:anhydro-N-acetylmuramic acid kinase